MERLGAIEGIRALAEVGGDEALGDRTPLGVNLLAQLARQDQVLESRQLRFAQVHAPLELRSEVGRGTVFTLRLPVGKAPKRLLVVSVPEE